MKNLFFIFITILTYPSFAFETLAVDNRTPAKVYLPKDLETKNKLPLIISLHGFLSGPKLQDKIFSGNKFIDSRGFILITPYGTRNPLGIRYWNATKACCDIFHQGPDDISYLKKLIQSALKNYPIDPEKVFLVGHSNGGFLAYRFACEAADLISGIVSISGANNFNQEDCHPSRPVSILQIHGTKDRIIRFSGSNKKKYPSAFESILPWSLLNSCEIKDPSNFSKITDEVNSLGWNKCLQKKSVLLWTVKDRRHNQILGSDLTTKILDFLFN